MLVQSGAGRTPLLWEYRQHGPLPIFLLVLTFVTGLVDAVSYFKLGHVFVANMTGNLVFLGFAVADAADFSVSASLVAICAFLIGAVAGGRLGQAAGQHRGRYLAYAAFFKIALIGAAFALSLAPIDPRGGLFSYSLITLLAAAMGLQNASARRLGVPDLTTTVLTLTLTGLAADSALAGGSNAYVARRLVATVTMLAGAVVGAFMIIHAGLSASLALALALQVANGIGASRLLSSSESWTGSS